MDLQMGKGRARGPDTEIWHEAEAGPGVSEVCLEVKGCCEMMGGDFWSEWRKEWHHALAGLQYTLSNTHLPLQAIERSLCGSAVLKTSIYFVCLHD